MENSLYQQAALFTGAITMFQKLLTSARCCLWSLRPPAHCSWVAAAGSTAVWAAWRCWTDTGTADTATPPCPRRRRRDVGSGSAVSPSRSRPRSTSASRPRASLTNNRRWRSDSNIKDICTIVARETRAGCVLTKITYIGTQAFTKYRKNTWFLRKI